jgi:hypothetical protein
MKQRPFLALSFAAVVTACPSVPPPWPPTLGDAGPQDACASAQANIERLSCSATLSPDGIPFATTCRQRLAAGRNLRPECIARESFTCPMLTPILNLPGGAPCP